MQVVKKYIKNNKSSVIGCRALFERSNMLLPITLFTLKKMRKTIFLFNLIFLPNVLHYYCGKSIALFVRTIEYISHKFMSNLVIPHWGNLSFIDPQLGGFGVIFPEVMIFRLSRGRVSCVRCWASFRKWKYF
jgi:hypothetical protein